MADNRNGPSATTEDVRPRDDREKPPATPFLVIPEDDHDNGFRPHAGTGWISSQSILLLNDQGILETAPRLNASYRLLVLAQNLGAAPVQNGFAEFFLAPKPPLAQPNPAPFFVYQQTPMVQDPRWMNLGVSAFSLPSSSFGKGEIGWALSPGTWTPGDLGPCAVVRVFEPISDGPGTGQESWKDRKVAFRAFNANFAGTWVGTEADAATGAALGPVELVIKQNWNIAKKGNIQAYTPACSIDFDSVKLPSLPTGTVDSDGILPSMSGSMYFTLIRQGGTLNLKFTFQNNGLLEMDLVRDGARRSITSLKLTQAGTTSPEPAMGRLLKRVRQVIPSYWPDQRKKDARIVYSAIAALP